MGRKTSLSTIILQKTVTSSQQDDLTGHKEDEVILEESAFPVIVFWFRIRLKRDGHPIDPGY